MRLHEELRNVLHEMPFCLCAPQGYIYGELIQDIDHHRLCDALVMAVTSRHVDVGYTARTMGREFE